MHAAIPESPYKPFPAPWKRIADKHGKIFKQTVDRAIWEPTVGKQASISKQASGQWDAKSEPIAQSVGEQAKPAQAVQREKQREYAPLWSGCSCSRTT